MAAKVKEKRTQNPASSMLAEIAATDRKSYIAACQAAYTAFKKLVQHFRVRQVTGYQSGIRFPTTLGNRGFAVTYIYNGQMYFGTAWCSSRDYNHNRYKPVIGIWTAIRNSVAVPILLESPEITDKFKDFKVTARNSDIYEQACAVVEATIATPSCATDAMRVYRAACYEYSRRFLLMQVAPLPDTMETKVEQSTTEKVEDADKVSSAQVTPMPQVTMSAQ